MLGQMEEAVVVSSVFRMLIASSWRLFNGREVWHFADGVVKTVINVNIRKTFFMMISEILFCQRFFLFMKKNDGLKIRKRCLSRDCIQEFLIPAWVVFIAKRIFILFAYKTT